MFSFIVVVVVGTNAYAQFDKVKVRQQKSEAVNMTDKFHFICLQIDASSVKDQLKDKEHQAQCKKFLNKVNIYEMRESIN